MRFDIGLPRFLALLVASCASSGIVCNEGNVKEACVSSLRADGARLIYSPCDSHGPRASAQNAAFSPDGARIVFTLFVNGYNEGPAELWIVDVDGSPSVSPEGQSVAFESHRSEDENSPSDLWIIPTPESL